MHPRRQAIVELITTSRNKLHVRSRSTIARCRTRRISSQFPSGKVVYLDSIVQSLNEYGLIRGKPGERKIEPSVVGSSP